MKLLAVAAAAACDISEAQQWASLRAVPKSMKRECTIRKYFKIAQASDCISGMPECLHVYSNAA